MTLKDGHTGSSATAQALASGMATDWALEVFKLAGTAVSVFIGGRLAFYYSEQGRKQDILFKEKYKAFEGAVSILLDIEYHFYLMEGLFDITPINEEDFLDEERFQKKKKDIETVRSFWGRLVDLRKFLILNTSERMITVRELQSEIGQFAFLADDYLNSISRKENYGGRMAGSTRLESIRSIHSKAAKIRADVRGLITTLFLEQGLPTPHAPFSNETKKSKVIKNRGVS